MDSKKLRQKILDLAIHGKLVPQDPNDEPASVLLERIRTEKERLVKEGKIKKSKASKTSDTPHYEQVPFEVPSSWEWCKVNDIGEIITGNTPSKDNAEFYKGNIPFFKPTDLEQGKNVINSSDHLSDSGFEQSRQLPINSILVTCIGATIGKTGLISVIGSCNQQINAIIPNKIIFPLYGYYVCNSNYMQTEIKEHASATTLPILNKGNFSNLLFPLPPLSEQFRIVAEIEKWFSLIDTIESEKANLQTIIKQAKSKILDFAIHGKLVPQDPNDEPASKLLKRINPNAEITCDNGQYGKIPEKWIWTTVNDISKSILYGVSESAKSEGKYKLLRITDIQNNHVDWDTVPFTDFDDKKVSSYILNNGDIVFARTGATVGKSYLIKELNQKAIYASYLIRVRTFDLILPEYVKLFFESGYYWEQIELSSIGIGQPNVNGTILRNLKIPLPPLAEQHRIVAKIEELFTSLDNIQKALEV